MADNLHHAVFEKTALQNQFIICKFKGFLDIFRCQRRTVRGDVEIDEVFIILKDLLCPGHHLSHIFSGKRLEFQTAEP